jgi:hypothetical protein
MNNIFLLVAISLTIGLVSLAYGFQEDPRYLEMGKILNYCYEHASDSANPAQDLVDKGILDFQYPAGITCGEVKQDWEHIHNIISAYKNCLDAGGDYDDCTDGYNYALAVAVNQSRIK